MKAIYRDIPEELRAMIEPVVDEHDCELVDVEVARNNFAVLCPPLLRSRLAAGPHSDGQGGKKAFGGNLRATRRTAVGTRPCGSDGSGRKPPCSL